MFLGDNMMVKPQRIVVEGRSKMHKLSAVVIEERVQWVVGHRSERVREPAVPQPVEGQHGLGGYCPCGIERLWTPVW
jgi:hypothetical protein